MNSGDLPRVLVGGYPNSGTSFLCGLVAALGYSPGSADNLKPGDTHNRWGYFEHLPMRRMTWEAAGFDAFAPQEPDFLPDVPLAFDTEEGRAARHRILQMAKRDDVQVYKDNALPVLFRLFPPSSKYLISRRGQESIRSSPEIGNTGRYGCSAEELRDSIRRYYALAEIMATEVSCLCVDYERFKTDFDGALETVCVHLEIPVTPEIRARCMTVYRPREAAGASSHLPLKRALRGITRRIKKLLSTSRQEGDVRDSRDLDEEDA